MAENRSTIRRRAAALVAGAAAVALAAGCSSSVSGSGNAKGSAPQPSGSTAPATVYRTVTATPSSTPSSSPSAPSSVSAPPTMPSDFVGTWFGHGRSLTITASGALTMTYRTYVNCSATVTTGCDQTVNNQIHDGGAVTAHLTQVVNPTTVMVAITASSAPSLVPIGSARLGFDQTHDAVALFTGDWANAPFCGTHSPSGYCGA